MKKIITVLIVLLFVFPAAAEEDSVFFFRKGVSFGMSRAELLQIEAGDGEAASLEWKTQALNDWEALYTSGAKVSKYEADLIYFLMNDRMETAFYIFYSQADQEIFNYLSEALSSLYGTAERIGSEQIVEFMDIFYEGYYSVSDISLGRAWRPGNVDIYQFFFSDDSFAIAYADPELRHILEESTFDTTGL